MRVVVDALLRDAGFEGSVNALFVPLCLPKAGRPARQAELPVQHRRWHGRNWTIRAASGPLIVAA